MDLMNHSDFSLIIAIISIAGVVLSFWYNRKILETTIVELKQNAYSNLKNDHLKQKRLLIKDPEITHLFKIESPRIGSIQSKEEEHGTKETEESSRTDKKIILFYIIELDLYERIYLEYSKGTLGADHFVRWQMWFEFIKDEKLEYTFHQFRKIFSEEAMNIFEKNILGEKPECPECPITKNNLEQILGHVKELHPRKIKHEKFKTRFFF